MQKEFPQSIRKFSIELSKETSLELEPFLADVSLSKGAIQTIPSYPLPIQSSYQLLSLADMIIESESGITHNLAALQALCADYREKDKNEAKIAEILVKVSNAAAQSDSLKQLNDSLKTSIMPASLFFKTAKPNVVLNGIPVSNLLLNPENNKLWNTDNLAKVLRESFGKINVN